MNTEILVTDVDTRSAFETARISQPHQSLTKIVLDSLLCSISRIGTKQHNMPTAAQSCQTVAPIIMAVTAVTIRKLVKTKSGATDDKGL